MNYIRNCILGMSMYVPDRILTNNELEKMVDTSDEWIYSRTGIRERRISTENTSVLGAKSVEKLLNKLNKDPKDIDLIIFSTITPDNNTPSCACLVQKTIGASNATAFDLNAACTGFIYGLVVADALLSSEKYRNAIVIGSEMLSKIIDWKDRNTCVLFGDGAGVAYIERSKNGHKIVDTYTRSVGEKSDSLVSAAVPISNFILGESVNSDFSIHMDGREVFKFAVSSMVEGIDVLLKNNNISIKDIKFIVPHQANKRIIESASQRLKIDVDKFFINLHKYGNTSAASIPIALTELSESQNLSKGDLIILVGFGGGLTYGSILIEW
ncbi:beta-ketoacyl-ACP synthase III [Candidatus Arthromitus sp. SFB-rat-Yit]|uniref:beta-ketoacyl-ACP synthase III n=1 Tax=Candidatus Arthromitus sp. SFB-rat-Yit TaxID=1041504 RepID=UPI000227A15C|nr:beta-ketoacyl-ACP synthase III [Candidatus Arthromitus sp. SFB-rat-Yit]BAK81274.1 3-oxoacyl-(acyl carrier protein) synthase III [Candidatus Arthromitus sp. SFB-rat-Yit]